MSEKEVSLDRRAFFTKGWSKAVEKAKPRRSRRWIRPPYALPELEFLIKCNGCGDCISACPHGVLFPLPAKSGQRVENTPALDLLNRGCHMCDGWPCVSACEPEALKRPEQPGPMPKLAQVTIDTETCLAYLGPECGACAHACPVPGALRWEGGVRPVIETDLCTGCALCREACIVEPKAIKVSAYLHDEETMEVT